MEFSDEIFNALVENRNYLANSFNFCIEEWDEGGGEFYIIIGGLYWKSLTIKYFMRWLSR